MGRTGTRAAAGALVALLAGSAVAGETLGERMAANRAAVKDFSARLASELQAALVQDGPVGTLKVCTVAAPAMAEDLSRRHGWTIGRTSLKPRNPANAPDAWERRVLEQFAARTADGAVAADLEHADIVEENGGRFLRYMKAIAIPDQGAPCTTCHGTDLDPALAQAIRELYPDDPATGYAPGDLRGAFTVRQPL